MIDSAPASAREQGETVDSKKSPTTGQAHREEPLTFSLTLSTKHYLTPSGLNNIKFKENLKYVEGNVRWKLCAI